MVVDMIPLCLCLRIVACMYLYIFVNLAADPNPIYFYSKFDSVSRKLLLLRTSS